MNANCDTSDEATQAISFWCAAPNAHAVYLIGDFNAWNHTADPMERLADGHWHLQVRLRPGLHHYQFLVDTEAKLDPHAMYQILEDRQEKVSLIALTNT
jgi:1,4-alpha-glucan branching enzyme